MPQKTPLKAKFNVHAFAALSMAVLGLTGCATSSRDTSGTAAVDRMYQHYADQTVQAFNRLNGNPTTDFPTANRPLVEQAVLTAIDQSADEAFRKAASKSNATPTFLATSAEDAPVAEVVSVKSSVEAAPTDAPTNKRVISLAEARGQNVTTTPVVTVAPIAPVVATVPPPSAPAKQVLITPETKQVLSDKAFGRAMIYLDKAANEGKCPAVSSIPQAAKLSTAPQPALRALALPLTFKPYSGDIEELANSIAQSIGYTLSPYSGTKTTPVIVTYGTTCRSAVAALQDISSLVGEAASLEINPSTQTLRWQYAVGNKAFAK